MRELAKASEMRERVDSTGAWAHSLLDDQAIISARLGHSAEADSLIRELEAVISDTIQPDSNTYYGVRSQVEFYRERYDLALEYANRAVGPHLNWRERVGLGRIHLGASRLRDAVQMFEQALDTYDDSRWWNCFESVLLYYYAGQAYERSGRTEEAVAHYERFLHIWRDADIDLPELVDAKKRLAALQT
jgi:tetratricopeptide (TPR) repeat protein